MASHFSSASDHGGDIYTIEAITFSHKCIQALTQCFMYSIVDSD